MKAKYLTIATVAMLLAACSNDEDVVNNGPVEARVTAGMGTSTRAVNTNNEWTATDAIGVMVTSAPTSGTGMTDRYKNVKYVAEQSASTASFKATGQGVFFQNADETVTFAAYYPYQESSANALPGTDGNGVISVNTQDNNTADTQAKIDFLYASGATATKGTPTVEFKDNTASSGTDNQFQHKMAQLKLVIQASTNDGFTDDEAKGIFNNDTDAYQLSGLVHAGTFTISTTAGAAATTSGSSPVDNWDITGCVHTDNDQMAPYTRTYSLILLPQDASTDGLTLSVSVCGKTFTCKNEIKPSLQTGNSYTYTIMVKKTGLMVSGCTIDPWGDVTGGNGEATM